MMIFNKLIAGAGLKLLAVPIHGANVTSIFDHKASQVDNNDCSDFENKAQMLQTLESIQVGGFVEPESLYNFLQILQESKLSANSEHVWSPREIEVKFKAGFTLLCTMSRQGSIADISGFVTLQNPSKAAAGEKETEVSEEWQKTAKRFKCIVNFVDDGKVFIHDMGMSNRRQLLKQISERYGGIGTQIISFIQSIVVAAPVANLPYSHITLTDMSNLQNIFLCRYGQSYYEKKCGFKYCNLTDKDLVSTIRGVYDKKLNESQKGHLWELIMESTSEDIMTLRDKKLKRGLTNDSINDETLKVNRTIIYDEFLTMSRLHEYVYYFDEKFNDEFLVDLVSLFCAVVMPMNVESVDVQKAELDSIKMHQNEMIWRP